MSKKRMLEFLLILLFLGLLADYMAKQDSKNALKRGAVGQGDKNVEYELSAEGICQDAEITFTVESKAYSFEEAEELFYAAEEEIDDTVLGENEDYQHVDCDLLLKDSYCDGRVKAKWYVSRSDALTEKGQISDRLPDIEHALSGVEVELEARLSVSGVEMQEIYLLHVVVYPKKQTKEEQLLSRLQQVVEMQSKEADQVLLPKEVEGVELIWKQKKPYYALKLLGLGLTMILLLEMKKAEDVRRAREARKEALAVSYPELLSRFVILMGAGMTTRQAFQKLVEPYLEAKKKPVVYEELIYTLREIEEGESERLAYQKFADRVESPDYRRFIRILLQQQKKGGAAFLEELNYDLEQSYRNQKAYVKRLAEEASTKLLFPMILMLGIVLAIVLAPAMVEINI